MIQPRHAQAQVEFRRRTVATIFIARGRGQGRQGIKRHGRFYALDGSQGRAHGWPARCQAQTLAVSIIILLGQPDKLQRIRRRCNQFA